MLNITIPAGKSHDLDKTINASGIMQPVSVNDFEVEVKFQSVLNKKVQSQGIIVEQDMDNFLRFDFYTDGTNLWVYAGSVSGGNLANKISPRNIGNASDSPIPLYMRVKRIGNQWTQNYSFDGINWINSASFSETLIVTSVGPYAGNAPAVTGNPATAPAFNGLIDYFFNTASPILNEDPLIPEMAPKILTQPVDQIVKLGKNATFTVVAIGTYPISYQWRKNGIDIPGATNPSYTTPQVTMSDNGAIFSVRVNNSLGNVISNSSKLSVNNIVSDDFNTANLDTSTWTVINPKGDATFSMVNTGSQDAMLKITVPGGISHDALYPNNAPRIMQTADNTDFEIETKFQSQETANAQLQGMIIEQDSSNFIRFDYSRTTTTEMYVIIFKNGVMSTKYTGVANATIPPNNSLYMRINRTGDDWKEFYSYDNITWIPAADFNYPMIVSSVGPFVGNAGSYPAFTGLIDYFFNTSSPKVPEDEVLPDTAGPAINLWYGKSQNFGQKGVPQQWVNILGNVQDPAGVSSLKYSLNHGIVTNLSIGPDTRLESIGDFNVEINHSALLCGNNQLVLTAADNLGNSRNENVSINYFCNNVWPLPYTIIWSNSAKIQDVSQVVDGLWTKDANGVRPAIIGYDRMITMGDMTWKDYEITAPITINSPLDSSLPIKPNFGFIVRWQGHWDWNSKMPASWQFTQPRPTWYPLGALGVYIWVPTLNDYRLRIVGNSMALIAEDTSGKHLDVGVPYIFKMSARTNGSRTLYTLKVWQKNQSESTALTISGYGVAGELKQGSVTLNAHNANVSFGDISIRPLYDSPDICCVSVETHEHDATVNWITSKPASSRVSYGLSTAYEIGTQVNGTMALSHSIFLNNLQPGTRYYYLINSTDIGGNSTNITDLAFITMDLTAPNITKQPMKKTIINGSTATFSVVASGTAPLSYQWMKNGADITGATGSSYTTPAVKPSDNGTRYSVLVSNAYGSATSNEAALFVIEQPPLTWCDKDRSFRVPVTIGSAGFERYEKPVDVSINFTQMLGVLGQTGTFDENSIRVVETDSSGSACSSPVPSQFDKDTGFNAATKASGTVVFIMNGTTPANANRYYQVYFGLTGGSYSPLSVTPRLTLTDNVTDEGQSSFRIAASGSTYYFQKQAGGFSSLVDSSGNDWISYAPIAGSAEFRGIPNVAAVAGVGIFHPGFTCCTSSIVTQGPLKVRVRAVSPDGKWESLWDFYPGYATMTMVKAATSYYFLYEGTPGGALEPNKDFMVRPDNTKTMLSETWTNDLDAQEWAYFSDATADRSLFAAHHEDDPLQETYWPLNTNVLTVFGFGRSDNPATGLLSSLPQHYTIGLMNGTDFAQNARTVYSAYKDLSITKGGIEQYDSVMLPTIMQQPADRIVVPGVSPTFSVTATGQLPLSYQWQKNGTDIPGATNASYTAPSATAPDNGSVYRVVASNEIGNVTSDPATLTVISYSNNQLVVLDVNYEHNTVITKVPYSLGYATSGKSSSFFNFPSYVPDNFKSPIDYAHGTMYQRLQVLTKPSSKMAKYQICMFQTNITTSQHACTNRDLLAFTGTGTYYATQSMTSIFQYGNLNWTQKLLIIMLDITDKNGVLIDDRTAYNFNKTWDGGNTNLGLYYPMKVRYTAVIVPPGGGAPIWPVDTPPGIVTQPANKITVIGDTATFSVAATSTGTAPLYYQWQKNGANIDGAYSSSYTIPPATEADDGSVYRVVVSNKLGSITSNGSVLTLVPSINLIQNPGFESGTTSLLTNWTKYQLNAGATLSKVTPGYDGTSAAKLAITSVGTSPDIQLYQTGIPLEQGRYLEPNTHYRLRFAAYSSKGHDMTVRLVRATSLNLNYGLDYTANLNTSWQVFTTEFNTTNFTSKVKDGRLQFRLGSFAKVGDNYFIDNVSLEKVIAAVPPQIVRNAPNGMDIPVTAVISVNFSKLMNQTSVQSAFSTYPAITGSFSWSGNKMTFTPVSLNYSMTYNVTIGIAAADLAGNNMAIPFIWNFTTMDRALTSPSITIQPSDQIVKTGDTATFSVVATGTEPMMYHWQRNGEDISGATSATYTTPSTALADNGTAFRVVVSNAAGSTTSNKATLVVVPLPIAPTITMQPSNQMVSEGEAATFSVVATGTAPIIYQWQRNGVDIPGATSATYTIPSTALSDSGSTFRVNITNAAGSITSNEVTLIVVQRLLINIESPADGSIDTTGNVDVIVTLSRQGIAILNWEGLNQSMIQQGTSFYVNKTGLLSGNYNFRVYASDSNGISNISESRSITVDRNVSLSFEDIIDTTTFITNSTRSITSPGGNVAVTIFNNTNASVNNSAVTSISIDSLAKINSTFVANLGSDKLIGENITLGPEGAIFNPDIQIRFNYSGAQLTAAGIGSVSQLRIKFYNKTTNSWDVLTPYTLYQNGSDGYLIANASHFSTFALIGVPASSTGGTKCCTGSNSGSGGSSSGGGGGSSGENYTNIEVIEKYDMQISKDVLTSYRFTHAKNPIMFVNITGNTSLGIITASIEGLKNTSTLVKVSPEGLVYRNANIWVGTAGFASPKNIKEALIKFRIDNAWMSTNGVSASDIVLMKWDGKSWIKLETKVLSKDDTNSYFEGKTNAFSQFAIVAKTAPIAKPAVTTTPAETPKITATGSPEPTKKAPGFGIVLALVGLTALALRKRS